MLCLLFNFYKENAVREWSFKRAITIQTYEGYDPIPVPLNIIYRTYKIFHPKEYPSSQDKVSVKKQSYFFGKASVVFVQCIWLCLFLVFVLFLFDWLFFVSLNYAKDLYAHVSLAFLFCFKVSIRELLKKLEAVYFTQHGNSFPISGTAFKDHVIPVDTKTRSAIGLLKGPIPFGHQWGLGG